MESRLILSIAVVTLAAAMSCGGRSERDEGRGAPEDGGTGAAVAAGGGRLNHGGHGNTTDAGRATASGGTGGRTTTANAGAASGGALATNGGGGQASGGVGGDRAGDGGNPQRGPALGEGGVESGGQGGRGDVGGQGGEGGRTADSCGEPGTPTLRVPEDYSTIAAAIAASSGAAVIAVGPGIYFENLDFGGKSIVLVSTSGPSETVIDGGNHAAVITLQSGETAGASVEGFTIQNGQDYWGAGITLQGASPTIRNNWFLNNYESVGGFGAAIGGNSASPVIDSNYFSGNWCDDQFVSGVLSFVNDSSPRIVNNIIYDNDCRGINVTAPSNVTPDVSNNTLVDNRTGIYVDARVSAAGQLYRNNLIVGGNVGLEVAFLNGGYGPTWVHNLVFGSTTAYDGLTNPTGTLGNLATDPLLVNADQLDFRLVPGSPAIDAGTSDGPALPRFDYRGSERIAAGTPDSTPSVDLGAYEFAARLVCPRKN